MVEDALVTDVNGFLLIGLCLALMGNSCDIPNFGTRFWGRKSRLASVPMSTAPRHTLHHISFSPFLSETENPLFWNSEICERAHRM